MSIVSFVPIVVKSTFTSILTAVAERGTVSSGRAVSRRRSATIVAEGAIVPRWRPRVGVVLYLTEERGAQGGWIRYNVTNWPGTLKFQVTHSCAVATILPVRAGMSGLPILTAMLARGPVGREFPDLPLPPVKGGVTFVGLSLGWNRPRAVDPGMAAGRRLLRPMPWGKVEPAAGPIPARCPGARWNRPRV